MICESVISDSLFENNNFSITDLHIHGKYAISTSKTLNPNELKEGAIKKGVNLLGSGDCLYEPWINEFKGYWGNRNDVTIVPTTEISVHFKNDKIKYAIHLLIVFPSIEIAYEISEKLKPYGNVQTMARPNVFLPIKKLCEIVSTIHKEICIIPAHIFTPYFSILGARGLDNLADIKDLLTACETGISADPTMCSKISVLDGIPLVSFSDAHSSRTIGREATVLNKNLSLKDALKHPALTIECFPQFGKYHATGHAKCQYISLEGSNEKRCRICGKIIPQGVVDRLSTFDRTNRKTQAFVSLIPLDEVISTALKVTYHSKAVKKLIECSYEKIGPEIYVLLIADEDNLSKAFPDKVVELILQVRKGNIKIKPGYDGVYGCLKI